MIHRLAWLLALLPAVAGAQFTPTERQGIEDALFMGNLTERDLAFERKPFRDPYRMALVDLSIDHPLRAADVLMALHSQAAATLSGPLSVALRQGFGESTPGDPPPLVGDPTALAGLPPSLRRPVANLAAAVHDADIDVRDALGQLRPNERQKLLDGLPQWANEEPGIRFSFVQGKPVGQPELLRLLALADLPDIRQAAWRLARRIEAELPALRASDADLAKPTTFRAHGIEIEVSGRGSDAHDAGKARLCIDLGGADSYRGRYAAGHQSAGVLIDLGGDDLYAGGDFGVGAGLLGIGISIDDSGDDTYRTGSATLGMGLAGVGIHLDSSGNDRYEGRSLTQGFAAFGVGLLLDGAGDDDYRAAFNAQGAAKTQGLAWLVDAAGGDTYRAGGLILNSPLFADVYYSNAQGFASGYREDTGGISGGIGLLTDLGGDDAYVGETYCQAASYWFALGSLYDKSGHDTYTAYHYAQSSAMHMCSAYLFDLAGDDAYACKFGASHAIGHDYGVAVLFDRAGSDLYVARDSRPGVGNANGLGLFVDAAGDDRYFGPPGNGNPARGSGSLGLFADLGGADRYASGLADGQAATGESWRVAMDMPIPPARGASVAVAPEPPPKAGSKPMPDEAGIAELYRKATQWGVGTAQREVEESTRTLIAIGMPALRWMVERRLPKADRLQQRAFVQVVTALGPEAKSLVAARLASADDEEVKVALNVTSESFALEAGPFIPGLLKRPAVQRSAARVAGVVKSREAIPDLVVLTVAPDRLLALNALISLGQIGDESAAPALEAMLRSEELPLRKAAIAGLAQFPTRALAAANALLSSPDERLARTGVEMIGAIGTPAALELLAPMLAASPGRRIAALQALDGRCPPALRPAMAGLRDDPDVRVRAVARGVEVAKP